MVTILKGGRPPWLRSIAHAVALAPILVAPLTPQRDRCAEAPASEARVCRPAILEQPHDHEPERSPWKAEPAKALQTTGTATWAT